MIKFEELESLEIEEITECLKRANHYGLLEEVVISALFTMKECPDTTCLDAIKQGMKEWDV